FGAPGHRAPGVARSARREPVPVEFGRSGARADRRRRAVVRSRAHGDQHHRAWREGVLRERDGARGGRESTRRAIGGDDGDKGERRPPRDDRAATEPRADPVMTREELIEKIARAIAEMEGFYVTAAKSTLAQRNANPVNIRQWRDARGRPYP